MYFWYWYVSFILMYISYLDIYFWYWAVPACCQRAWPRPPPPIFQHVHTFSLKHFHLPLLHHHLHILSLSKLLSSSLHLHTFTFTFDITILTYAHFLTKTLSLSRLLLSSLHLHTFTFTFGIIISTCVHFLTKMLSLSTLLSSSLHLHAFCFISTCAHVFLSSSWFKHVHNAMSNTIPHFSTRAFFLGRLLLYFHHCRHHLCIFAHIPICQYHLHLDQCHKKSEVMNTILLRTFSLIFYSGNIFDVYLRIFLGSILFKRGLMNIRRLLHHIFCISVFFKSDIQNHKGQGKTLVQSTGTICEMCFQWKQRSLHFNLF